jgi:hypothetical protein
MGECLQYFPVVETDPGDMLIALDIDEWLSSRPECRIRLLHGTSKARLTTSCNLYEAVEVTRDCRLRCRVLLH